MIKTILFLTVIQFSLVNCGSLPKETDSSDKDQNATGGMYPVRLDSGEIEKYVPQTDNHVADTEYMKNIDDLFEQLSGQIGADPDFINLAKAIGWTESNWQHYILKDQQYFVLTGDDGHSFGLMQIHDEYHDRYPNLEENLDYGIEFAYQKLLQAQQQDCQEGTNKGTDIVAIARRTYAQYNGGDAAMCRDDDHRDNNLEKYFTDQPWESYL